MSEGSASELFSRWLFTAEAPLCIHIGPRGIRGGRGGIRTGFSPSPSVSPGHYHFSLHKILLGLSNKGGKIGQEC
jgi:hypothetical protein